MNAHIIKLFGLFTVLFALLIGFTSWWSVLDADTQKERSSNRRALIEEQTIPRGLIFARDGETVLAKNIARGPREDTPRARNLRTFVRTYPEGPLFGHAVGYSYLRNGRRGLEQSENRSLAGEEERVPVDLLPAAKPGPRGPRRGHHARPRGAEGRAERPGRQAGRDRGVGAADRPGPGDGQHSDLRPQPDPDPVRTPQRRQRGPAR